MAAGEQHDATRPEDHVRRASRPSEPRITDLRTATVGWDHWHFTIIRIDTNQGLCGYGEVRDLASKTYALMLKSRLLGENPCNVDRLFRKIKQFGHHGRQGGGVCGVEMALMDLAGKAYGVPAYMLAGGKFRDRIRMYCDTPNEPTGEAMGRKLSDRLDAGFTHAQDGPGRAAAHRRRGRAHLAAGHAAGRSRATHVERISTSTQIMHPFTHVRLTPKGIALICEYVEQVRAVVGDAVPIAADHFGHIGVDDCIRLGQALEPYNLAWLEDLVPWQFTDQWVQIERALHTPVCTGEDIYLKEGFRPLLEARGVNVIHPDLATSGGILETKKIGDLAQEHGISMALHMAGTPISTLASVHCAAATENFIALEHHFTDMPFWNDFIDGVPKPLIQHGYIRVPEGAGPGLRAQRRRRASAPGARGSAALRADAGVGRAGSHDRLWS